MTNSDSTPGRYRKVYPRLWRNQKFRALKGSARELTFYLLSGPQTNRIGIFYFSIATAAEDMSMSTAIVRRALREVCAAFDWRFDEQASVFYIPSWWRWNAPENSNVLHGILKDLNEIAAGPLVYAFAENLECLPDRMDRAGGTFHQTFRECMVRRYPERPPIQEQEQEPSRNRAQQEQEHEQKQEKEPNPALPRGGGASRLGSSNAFRKNQYKHIAKKVLEFNADRSNFEVLLNTFGEVAGRSGFPYTKDEATQAINAELAARGA